MAIWSPGGGLRPADLERPLELLRHRGPDGTGRWVSDSGRVALGHTRLAVIDLAGGQQPIRDDRGRYCLVANGEFYEYERIREGLRGRGHRLVTASDSEIALHLYAEAGVGALAELRGEFAFVIWDEARGELLAARDRFGVKPLFYAEHDGRLLLASGIKALLSCGLAARWDVDSFADHLLVGHDAGRTLFDGVRQVPPGCYLKAGSAGITVAPYWDLDYPRADELPSMVGEAGHRDAVTDAVREAVRVRMRADVPVAYHLSGGIDSSSVAAVAAQEGPIATFTVRFDDEEFDESAVARRTAARLGARHEEVAVSRGDFTGGAEATVAGGEMIPENSHGIARLKLSAAIRRRGFKVALAGEGGDEIFGGYPQFQRDLTLTLSDRARGLARSSYERLSGAGAPRHLRALHERLGFVPNWVLDRYLNVTLPLVPLLRPEFAERLSAAGGVSNDLLSGSQLEGRSQYHQSMYLFCKTWFCNYILVGERLDMASAVETRLPFLDHRVHEVAKWTPLEGYVRDGLAKAVLRDAMAPLLSPEVRGAAKRGFFAPPAAQSESTVARFLDLVDRGALRDQPFFDPASVARFARRLRMTSPARRAREERLVQIVTGTCLLSDALEIHGKELA